MRHPQTSQNLHPRISALADGLRDGSISLLDAAQVEVVVQGIMSGFSRAFPRGAEIYWDNGPTDPGAGLDEFERARLFIKTMFLERSISVDEPVVLLWDDASDPTFEMCGSVLLARIVDILSPPNLYVVPRDVGWCICHTSHGELGFGYASASSVVTLTTS
jgi:hypothetical protein